jgi:hypothetical protein
MKSLHIPCVIDEWLRIETNDGGVGGALRKKTKNQIKPNVFMQFSMNISLYIVF